MKTDEGKRLVLVAAHTVIILEMPYDRLHCRATFEVTFDLLGDAAFLARGVDPELSAPTGRAGAGREKPFDPYFEGEETCWGFIDSG